MQQPVNTSDEEFEGLAPLKWEKFLKVMRDRGFTYDPNSWDSAVRFDPPNPSDPSITFHKPYPHMIIRPEVLRAYGKKLMHQYGWPQEEFYKAAANA